MILFNYYYYLLIGGSHPVYSLYGWLPSSLLLLMKDLAAVEEAEGQDAKVYEGEISFGVLNSFSLWMASEFRADSLHFSAS
jgi:hypothetical protein